MIGTLVGTIIEVNIENAISITQLNVLNAYKLKELILLFCYESRDEHTTIFRYLKEGLSRIKLAIFSGDEYYLTLNFEILIGDSIYESSRTIKYKDGTFRIENMVRSGCLTIKGIHSLVIKDIVDELRTSASEFKNAMDLK